MADTFTPLLRLNQQEVGAKEDLWAPPVSAGLNDGVVQLLEDAISGRSDISVTAGNVVLTTVNGGDDTSRPAILRVTGTPGVARDVEVPTLSKFYVAYNGSDAAITVKTTAGGGTTLNVGQVLLLIVDSVLDDVFPVLLTGSAVLEAAAWTTRTLENLGRTAGDEFVSYRYSSQGENAMVLFPSTSFTCSLNSWSMQDTVGTFPSEIVPGSSRVFPIWITDDGTQEEAYLVISTSDTVPFSIQKADGTNFVNATVRSILHNMALVYSTTAAF